MKISFLFGVFGKPFDSIGDMVLMVLVAVLSSVGMTPKEMNRMLSYECVLYGLKALLYGLPVSLLVTWVIYRVVGSGMDTEFYVPATSIVVVIASVFLVVFSTMLYAKSKLRKANIIDSIRQESL